MEIYHSIDITEDLAYRRFKLVELEETDIENFLVNLKKLDNI